MKRHFSLNFDFRVSRGVQLRGLHLLVWLVLVGVVHYLYKVFMVRPAGCASVGFS